MYEVFNMMVIKPTPAASEEKRGNMKKISNTTWNIMSNDAPEHLDVTGEQFIKMLEQPQDKIVAVKMNEFIIKTLDIVPLMADSKWVIFNLKFPSDSKTFTDTLCGESLAEAVLRIV